MSEDPTKSTRLSVVVHLHDPGFLADEEIRRLSLQPLEVLAGILQRHLSFRFGLYLPGRVLESAARSAPRLLDVLRQAGVSGRIEWLGGGFHDPLFAMIPESSRRSQIQMHTASLRQHVGGDPRGVWLPGFVWDHSLVSGFLQSGFTYTVLKDQQIPRSEDDGGLHWFLTEELGVPFRLLPSREALGALFRAGALEEMLQLASTPGASGSNGGVVDVPLLAGSREGFEPVHLERLSALAGLCDAEDSPIQLVLPLDATRQGEPKAVVYPPPSAARAFCEPGPGGGVRDLLRRHRWANLCHKRMLHLLSRAEQVPGPKIRALVADPLLQAQNASLFRDADEAGGIRYLRDRVRLGALVLEAESALDQTVPDDSVQVDALDLLCEGAQQVLVRNSKLSLLVEPRRGGRLSSLDYKPRHHPWGCGSGGDVLAEDFLEATVEAGDGSGQGIGDFRDRPFDVQYKRTGQDLQILMSRHGALTLGGTVHPLQMEKTLTVRSGKSQVVLTYKLTNTGAHLLLFGFRGALSVSSSEGVPEGQRHRLDSSPWVDLRIGQVSDAAKTWEISDKPAGISLVWELAKPARVAAQPRLARRNETDPGRLDGQEVSARWEIQLPPGESWSLISRLELGSTRKA